MKKIRTGFIFILIIFFILPITGLWADDGDANADASPNASPNAGPAALKLEEIMEAASVNAPGVVNAVNAWREAMAKLEDSVIWKSISLSGSASWSDNYKTPQPASRDPWSLSASLRVPIFSNLSISGSARLGGDISGSVSWSPLAKDTTSIELELKLFQADTALLQAKANAMLDAMTSFMDILSAEASRNNASIALEKAGTELDKAIIAQEKGEISLLALTKARAALPKAQAASDRAEHAVKKARLNLARLTGSEYEDAIIGGQPLDDSIVLDMLAAGWEAPANPATTKAVLDAQAALDAARKSPWFSGNGPISLSGSVSTSGSVSFSASVSLDWKLITAQSFRDRSITISLREESLASAIEAQDLDYEEAKLNELIARLSLEEAEMTLEASGFELAEAQILYRLGEVSEEDLQKTEKSHSDAGLALLVARINLAKARLSL